jgi:DNA-binding response OmpR family regulator
MEGQISSAPVKVLCVEDEQFISELYQRAMVQAGYDVKVVSSGAVGLEEAKTNTYDIILLDLMTPDILGAEVLARLRREAPDLKAKIIIATNLEQDDKTREAIEKQADGYLIKAEVTPKELVRFLEQL